MKKIFNNLTIRRKLVGGFGIVTVLTMALSFISFSTLSKINGDYSYLSNFPQRQLSLLKDLEIGIEDMRLVTVQLADEARAGRPTEEPYALFMALFEIAGERIEEYIGVNNADTQCDAAILRENNAAVDMLSYNLAGLCMQITEAYAAAQNEEYQTALSLPADSGFFSEAAYIIGGLRDRTERYLYDYSTTVTGEKNFINRLFVVIVLSIVCLSVVLAMALATPLCDFMKNLSDDKLESSAGHIQT